MKKIEKFIDHTLLKPEATPNQIRKLCQEAREHGFAAVCVNSSYVSLCAEILAGSDVAVCSVVGFPLGAMSTAAKVFEAEQAIRDGASEIDMVLHIGRFKAGEYDYVEDDISAVVNMAHKEGAIVKVIIETALLTDEEKRIACRLCVLAVADFVKTSTGFGGGGATVEDVRLIKEEIANKAKIKAAGGIGDYKTAVKMIKAGADRLGTSKSVNIMAGQALFLCQISR